MDGESELVKDERRSDPEPESEQVDAEVARLERQLEHPARQSEDVAGHHVVQVDISDPPAGPVPDSCDPRIEASQSKRHQ